MPNAIRRSRKHFLLLFTLSATVLLTGIHAYAQSCGDMIRTDTVLTHDIGPCPGYGLIISASITLNLNGFTISGQGHGIGVFNDEGGVLIQGPGTVTNFAIGVGNGIPIIAASPSTPVSIPAFRLPFEVNSVTLHGNNTGILYVQRTGGIRIINNEISGGTTGISVTETTAKIKGNNIYSNSGRAINIFDGSDMEIVSNSASENDSGLVIAGFADFANNRITVLANDFSGNYSTGLDVHGTALTLRANTVNNNGGDGMVISTHRVATGPGNLVEDNVANNNGNNGISVVNADGPGATTIVDNQAQGNTGFDLFWDGVGTMACWRIDYFQSSSPSPLPACP